MNKSSSIILLVIIGIVLVILGGAFGILYQSKQEVIKNEKIVSTIIKDLTSKTITSITAYGQVMSLDNNVITLSYGGDSIKVEINENSPVYALVNDSTGNPTQSKVDIKEIKKGDNINIALKLLSDGKLQGTSIFILTSTTK
jgi:hypothetical protein